MIPVNKITDQPYTARQEEWLFIGCLAERPTLFPLYCTEVDAEYFQDTQLRRFWQEACMYWKETGIFDVLGIVGRIYGVDIRESNDWTQEGNMYYRLLTGISWGQVHMVAASTHKARYRDMVHRYANDNIQHLIDEEKQRLMDGEDIEKVAEEIAEKKSKLHMLLGKKHVQSISTAHDDAFDGFIERVNAVEQGIQSALYGLKPLDDVTYGIEPGQFVVLGAQQATGKSVFAMNFALNMAKSGKSVLFVSLEMSHTQILKRVWSCMDNIPHNDLMKFKRDDALMVKIDALRERLERMNFDLLCEGGVTTGDIEKRLQKKQYDVVVVDYVQLMRSTGKTRYEEVTKISNGLKSLAMQYNVGVLGLAQITKDGQKSGRPYAHHLKDSSSLEQDAEVIMLLHKDSDDTDCQAGRAIKLYIDKNRNGVSGLSMKVNVDFSHMKILDASVIF